MRSAANSQSLSGSGGEPLPAASVTLRNQADTISSKIGVVSAFSTAALRALRSSSVGGAPRLLCVTAALHQSLTAVLSASLFASNSLLPDRSSPLDSSERSVRRWVCSAACASEGHAGPAPLPGPGSSPSVRAPCRAADASSQPMGVNSAAPVSSLSPSASALPLPSGADVRDAGLSPGLRRGRGPPGVSRVPAGVGGSTVSAAGSRGAGSTGSLTAGASGA